VIILCNLCCLTLFYTCYKMDQYQSPDSTYSSEDAEEVSKSPPPPLLPPPPKAFRPPSSNRFLVGSSGTTTVGTAPKLLLKATGSGSFQSTPVVSSEMDRLSEGGTLPSAVPKLIFTGAFATPKGSSSATGTGSSTKNASEAMGMQSLTSIAQRLHKESGGGGAGGGDGQSGRNSSGNRVPKMLINRNPLHGSGLTITPVPPPPTGEMGFHQHQEPGSLKMKMKGRLPQQSSTTSSSSPGGGMDGDGSNPAVVAMGKTKFERNMMMKPPPKLMYAGDGGGGTSKGGMSNASMDTQEMEMTSASNVSEIIGNVMSNERFYRKDEGGNKGSKVSRLKFNNKGGRGSLPVSSRGSEHSWDEGYQSNEARPQPGISRDPNFCGAVTIMPSNHKHNVPDYDANSLQAMNNLVSGMGSSSVPQPRPRFLGSGATGVGMRRFLVPPRQLPPLNPIKRGGVGRPRGPRVSAVIRGRGVGRPSLTGRVGGSLPTTSTSSLMSSSSVTPTEGIKLKIQRRDFEGNGGHEESSDPPEGDSYVGKDIEESSEAAFRRESAKMQQMCYLAALRGDSDGSSNSTQRGKSSNKQPGLRKPLKRQLMQHAAAEMLKHKEMAEADMVSATDAINAAALAVAEDKEDAQSSPVTNDNEGNARRTQRKRKPTKHYVTDMVVPRVKRRRKEDEEEKNTTPSEEPPPLTVTADTEPVLESTPKEEFEGPVPEIVVTPRGRGRGRGTGRGRGRPRGSTLASKMDRLNAALLSLSSTKEAIGQMVAASEAAVKEEAIDHSFETIQNVAEQTFEDPNPQPIVTPTKTRGRGRGRGSGFGRTPRGGRGSRGK
jgi:hypothetical protein